MGTRYAYTDKKAIKRAIRNYPNARALIERERQYIMTARPTGAVNGSRLPDPTFGAVNAICTSRRIEKLEEERAAVGFMLQQIRDVSYWRDIYAVIKAVLWDGLSIEETAAHLPGMETRTIKRYLRKAYLLVGSYMGLIEAA